MVCYPLNILRRIFYIMQKSVHYILNLMRSDNFIIVNKTLIKNIGLLPATMYAELCSRYNYFMEQGQLKEGYFYLTIEDATNQMGLSREEQDTAIRKLTKLGLIKKQVRKFEDDTTTKRYFKIVDNFELVMGLFQETEEQKNNAKSIDNKANVGITQSELRESRKAECVNNTTLQKNNIKEIILNNNNQSVSPEEEERTDEHSQKEIETIISNARVETYESEDFRETLKEVITQSYNDTSTRATIKRLKVEHIDIAKGIYIEQQSQQEIKKPLEYFKKCLISAVLESGLKGLF